MRRSKTRLTARTPRAPRKPTPHNSIYVKRTQETKRHTLLSSSSLCLRVSVPSVLPSVTRYDPPLPRKEISQNEPKCQPVSHYPRRKTNPPRRATFSPSHAPLAPAH